jgi:hypothetical protein
MESENPKSGGYGQWIIGLMLVAYLVTSFDYRQLSFQSPIVRVGSSKLSKDQMMGAMRVKYAQKQLSLFGAMQKVDEQDLVRNIIVDEIWDQEAIAMGMEVSQNTAKKSLMQRMSFLDDQGRLQVDSLKSFYQKNPQFFRFDLQFEEGQGAFLMRDDVLGKKLFRGQSDLLESENRFDKNKMAAFFHNNGVSLLQMIAAEQKTLRIRMLQNVLVKNIFLPHFYKDLAKKGQQQVRTWRSRFFPIPPLGEQSVLVPQKMVDDFLKNKITDGMKYSPELRTFDVMFVPVGGGDALAVEKNKTVIEDAIGGGQTVEDIAKTNGWIYGTVKSSPAGQAIDFSPAVWNQKNGEPLGFSSAVCDDILQRVFRGGKEGYTIPVENGALWIQVKHIHPARLLNDVELKAVAEYAVKKQMNQAVTWGQAADFAKELLGKGGGKGKKASRNKELNMKTHVVRATELMDKSAMRDIDIDVAMRVFQMNSSQKVQVIPTQGGYTVVQLVSIQREKQGEILESEIDLNFEFQWCNIFLNSYFNTLEKKYAQNLDVNALNQWLEELHRGA